MFLYLKNANLALDQSGEQPEHEESKREKEPEPEQKRVRGSIERIDKETGEECFYEIIKKDHGKENKSDSNPPRAKKHREKNDQISREAKYELVKNVVFHFCSLLSDNSTAAPLFFITWNNLRVKMFTGPEKYTLRKESETVADVSAT